MMATYFNGGSEIQTDNLQTLYLMNPSYAATNALTPATLHHTQQYLTGIPLAQPGSGTPGADLSRPSSFHEIPISTSGEPRFRYNLWSAANPSSSGGGEHNQIPTITFSVTELGSTMGLRGPSKQGLSLSLNSSSPAHMNAAAELSPGGGGSSESAILGSKYLKATQELLDEVVNMAGSGACWTHMAKAKAKAEAEITSDEDGASNGVKNGGGIICELSSAQRQELQMKKAKLLNMLDEVEQRYKQYQMQIQRLGSALEEAAGLGSAKSYTSLALHTISKQFRCLKDAIFSQVKETGRRMGEEEGTRLRMVEQQLRQQRAMQQLGMMHNQQHNAAWRPQRGLPERAVSVLRAWLFEHFLHPYPKDSDKHILANQTGLTRSQVSNWFINARVRLWKPMVEEMYVEEMKGASTYHEQKDSEDSNNTTTINNNNNINDPKYSSLTPKSTRPLRSHNDTSNPKPPPPPPPPPNNFINDIPNSTFISPQSGSTGPARFSLLGSSSSGMESILIQRSPKRQRNTVLDTHSPSSILSMDMKDVEPNNNNNKDLCNALDGGFGPNNYPVIDHIGSRFNPDDHHHQLGQSGYHRHHAGNTVSLTLGLPHCENLLSLSGARHHQQNFFSGGQAMEMGRRLDMGEPEWCGSQPGPHSGVGGGGGGGYEGGVDMQTRKRFAAAQLLPDSVA